MEATLDANRLTLREALAFYKKEVSTWRRCALLGFSLVAGAALFALLRASSLNSPSSESVALHVVSIAALFEVARRCERHYRNSRHSYDILCSGPILTSQVGDVEKKDDLAVEIGRDAFARHAKDSDRESKNHSFLENFAPWPRQPTSPGSSRSP